MGRRFNRPSYLGDRVRPKQQFQEGLSGQRRSHAWKQGAGGFKSNIDDFAKWAAAICSTRLLKEETKRIMWTPQRTSDGKVSSYGLGFVVSRRGELTVSHGGSQSESKTYLLVQPHLGRGVVVMSNCN